jgi:hypothetical protein
MSFVAACSSGKCPRVLIALRTWRLQRQIAAIESGVDPVLVGERIRALKGERDQAQTALSELDQQRQRPSVDLDRACAILDGLPDLSKSLARAEPELQRRIFEAFHLTIELDRNAPEVRLSALVSSAFAEASDLDALAATVTDKAIAGERSALTGDPAAPVERVAPGWPG